MPSARPLKVGQTAVSTLPQITESNDLVNGKQLKSGRYKQKELIALSLESKES